MSYYPYKAFNALTYRPHDYGDEYEYEEVDIDGIDIEDPHPNPEELMIAVEALALDPLKRLVAKEQRPPMSAALRQKVSEGVKARASARRAEGLARTAARRARPQALLRAKFNGLFYAWQDPRVRSEPIQARAVLREMYDLSTFLFTTYIIEPVGT